MEVGLHYPKKLHNYHKDYSLAPEKIKLEDHMLSPYCLEKKTNSILNQGVLIN